jgi:alkylation response protein AidB-like acyl-CoA dehydrogenase
MPYELSEEQQRLRETPRAFALEELIPGAADRDRTATYPARPVARLAELELMGIRVPSAYGGLGLDTPTQLVAVEELAYGDAALASIFTGHYLGLRRHDERGAVV